MVSGHAGGGSVFFHKNGKGNKNVEKLSHGQAVQYTHGVSKKGVCAENVVPLSGAPLPSMCLSFVCVCVCVCYTFTSCSRSHLAPARPSSCLNVPHFRILCLLPLLIRERRQCPKPPPRSTSNQTRSAKVPMAKTIPASVVASSVVHLRMSGGKACVKQPWDTAAEDALPLLQRQALRQKQHAEASLKT
jgi:cold shock CspA family protein